MLINSVRPARWVILTVADLLALLPWWDLVRFGLGFILTDYGNYVLHAGMGLINCPSKRLTVRRSRSTNSTRVRAAVHFWGFESATQPGDASICVSRLLLLILLLRVNPAFGKAEERLMYFCSSCRWMLGCTRERGAQTICSWRKTELPRNSGSEFSSRHWVFECAAERICSKQTLLQCLLWLPRSRLITLDWMSNCQFSETELSDTERWHLTSGRMVGVEAFRSNSKQTLLKQQLMLPPRAKLSSPSQRSRPQRASRDEAGHWITAARLHKLK